MTRVRFSATRVALIARNTLLEAVRQKLIAVLVVLTLALVAGAQFFRELNFGASELKFISDFGFGAMTFFGSILAIVAAAQLFFSEIENRTALTILAKPVLRSEFVFGKFAGVLLVLLAFTVLVALALCGALWLRETELRMVAPELFEHGGVVAYHGIAAFALLQWLKFGVIAAFTVLIASFSNTNLFSVVMGFFVLVICHLQYLAHDAWADTSMGLARWGVAALGLVFPNFQLFNLGDRVAAGEGLPLNLFGPVAAYGCIYIAVFLGLAVFSFRQREI